MKVKLCAHIASCFLLHGMRMRPFANNASVFVCLKRYKRAWMY